MERSCSYLVDTQADISVFKISSIPGRPQINTTNVINIKGITQDSVKSLGTLHMKLFTDLDILEHEFHVVPDEFNMESDGILGKDFLVYYRCRIDYECMTFTINNRYRNILSLREGPDEQTMTIPPRCEVVCVVDQVMMAQGVYTARTIVNPANAYVRR